MKNGFIYILILLVVLLWSCAKKTETEKYQYERNNIIYAKDLIKEIEIDSLMFTTMSNPYIIADYLLIADYRSYDHLIHLFDKKDFHYVGSMAYMGRGPGEITQMGYVGINEALRKIEVTDFGKQKIFSFDLDSALADPFYFPVEKLKIVGNKLLTRYKYISENICMGLFLEPIGSSDYKVSVGTQNMNTGEFKVMPYTHPQINKKRVSFAVSPEYGLYVECYEGQNLMTICTLDGKLKYNVYGGNEWKENHRGRKEFYRQTSFVRDKIFALFLDDNVLAGNPSNNSPLNQPTKFLVFGLNGDYIATIETDYRISSFCYDDENNRIIFSFNDDIQFGYLDLNGVI